MNLWKKIKCLFSFHVWEWKNVAPCRIIPVYSPRMGFREKVFQDEFCKNCGDKKSLPWGRDVWGRWISCKPEWTNREMVLCLKSNEFMRLMGFTGRLDKLKYPIDYKIAKQEAERWLKKQLDDKPLLSSEFVCAELLQELERRYA